jgi:transposase-like protein
MQMSQQASIKQQQTVQQQAVQSGLNGKLKVEAPDPEVVPQAKRRQFTIEYKSRILAEVERCQEPGQVGALLRREGLYSSHLSRWRQLRTAGKLSTPGSQKRGPKPKSQVKEMAQLRRENKRLRSQLEQAELVIDVQKKLSQLLGLMSETGSGERR